MSILDTSSQSSSMQQSQQQAGNQMQQNRLAFNPGQQQLQGQLGQMGQNLMQGNIPQNFMQPQSVTDWAMTQFNKFQAPDLANRYGGGTNLIGAHRNELIAQLAAQSGQQAQGNALNAFNSIANYATQSIGSNTNMNNATRGNIGQQNQASGRTLDFGGLADQIGYGLGAFNGF